MTPIGEVYARTRKVPDLPWNAYVCRPIAAVPVALLEHTRVTPNQITLAALPVAALGAALLVVVPGYAGLLAAILVYECSYVLDCADGMLARLRGGGSPQGHLLDFLMDEIKAFLVLAAVAIRLAAENGPEYLFAGLGGLVALGTGVGITTFLRRPEIAPPAAAATRPPAPSSVRRLVGAMESVARQIMHYPSYIWLAALVDRLDWYFWPYVGVNGLYALRALAQVAARFGRGVPS